jgi:hypothetical protein
MSISILFTPNGASRAQYDDSIRGLQKIGQWPPDGMEYHVAFGEGGSFRVLEVWGNQDKASAFADRLMPLLEDIGIDAGQPEFGEVIGLMPN